MLFGRDNQGNGAAAPAQPPANEVARIQGGGMVKVIVSSLEPLSFALFLNERPLSQLEVESLLVDIHAPSAESEAPRASATLSQYVKAVTGDRNLQSIELFPSTIEVIAAGRRVVVTCQELNNLEGVWIGLGLKPDGTSNEVTGAQALRMMVGQGILDARLSWTDGSSEDLFGGPSNPPGH